MNKIYKNLYLIGTFVLLFGAILACSEEEPINVPPTFKLNQVDNIMRTAATFSGSVSGDLSSIREYGFQYSTAEGFPANLTTEVEVGDSVKGKDLSATVRNLEPNTRYYYRLYATTGATTVYSNNEYFKTTESSAPLFSTIVVDSIGENMARFKCTIDDIGDEYLIEYGVGYKTATDKAYIPIPSDSIIPVSVAGAENTYFVEVNGLSPSTKYSFRPYAKNSTSADGSTGSREGYGDIVERTTESLLSAEVTTSEIADGHIGVNSIDVSATLKSATGSNGIINKCGFCWSKDNATPVITDDTLALAPVKVGEVFSATIKGLSPKTRYYVRSYATNTVNGNERVGYGETYEVTTGGLKTPTVEFEYEENDWGGRDYVFTSGPDSIKIKAFIDGKDFDENTMVEKGLIWSEIKGDITLSEAKEAQTCLSLDLNKGTATTIEGTIKGLKMNTMYFVRAYVVAKADGIEVIGYSDYLYIRTEDFRAPNLTETEVKDVTRSSATLVGGYYSQGNGIIKEKGFVISIYNETFRPELTTEGVIVVKSDDDAFTEQVTGLKFGMDYAVRTYAIAELAERIDTVYAWYRDIRTENVVGPDFKSSEMRVSVDTVRISCGLDKTGDGEIVERGFHWQEVIDNNYPQLTLENCEHAKATGTNESFEAVIPGLKYNTSYRMSTYVKSLVDGDTIVHYSGMTHGFGTGGALKGIERVSSGLTSITMISGIQGSGKGTIVEKGFIWLKGEGYWKAPDFESEENYTAYKAVTDDTNKEFSLEITGLEKNQDYYIRAYVKISCDGKEYISYSGTNHTSTQDYNMPNFTSMTVPNDSIGFSTALLKTSFNNIGNVPIIKKGFVVHYSETTYEPSLTNKLLQVDVEGDEFVYKLTGLKHNTRYSVRAFATCKVGDKEETSYSGNSNFGTKEPQGPKFNNLKTDSISINSLSYSCGIGEVKDGEVIEKGFIWKERPKNNYDYQYPSFEDYPDNENDSYTGYKSVESDSLQDYSLIITGLKPSTTYYVRSYAKVKVEEVIYNYYSGTRENGTSQLNVDIWFNASLDSCVVSGKFNDIKHLPEGVEEFGICYSSNIDEGVDGLKTTVKAVKAEDFEESGEWSVELGGLEASQQYYVGFYFMLNGEEVRLNNTWGFMTKRAPSINDNVSPGKQGDE